MKEPRGKMSEDICSELRRSASEETRSYVQEDILSKKWKNGFPALLQQTWSGSFVVMVAVDLNARALTSSFPR